MTEQEHGPRVADGISHREARALLRDALQGMVVDEIDLDPNVHGTPYAHTLVLRAFAMHGSKPSVEITLEPGGGGEYGDRRITVKVEPWLREDVKGAGIGGKALVAAVEGYMLRRRADGGEGPMHYGVILGGLEKEGVKVGGIDPAATLLTALGRSEMIESMGSRSGRYRLKEEDERGTDDLDADT